MMTENLQQQPAPLPLLNDALKAIERHRSNLIAAGENAADVDLEAGQIALTLITAYLEDHDVETWPIQRLLVDLVALSNGSKPSAMLAPRPTNHRRPDSPGIEDLKGRLAAVMEHAQRIGMSRTQAAEWVVKHTSLPVKQKLGLKSAATVDSWLSKWSGKSGAEKGFGRIGYQLTRSILAHRKLNENQLSDAMKSSDRFLPG